MTDNPQNISSAELAAVLKEIGNKVEIIVNNQKTTQTNDDTQFASQMSAWMHKEGAKVFGEICVKAINDTSHKRFIANASDLFNADLSNKATYYKTTKNLNAILADQKSKQQAKKTLFGSITMAAVALLAAIAAHADRIIASFGQ